MYAIAVGGNQIGESTVARLYGWHVFGLALPTFAIIVWHAFRVRRDGGIANYQLPITNPQRISRAELVRREALAAIVAFAALIFLSISFDVHLGLPADPGATVAEATAPWFFIWIQELLRLWPPLIAGVLVPLGALIVLAMIPYWIDRSEPS